MLSNFFLAISSALSSSSQPPRNLDYYLSLEQPALENQLQIAQPGTFNSLEAEINAKKDSLQFNPHQLRLFRADVARIEYVIRQARKKEAVTTQPTLPIAPASIEQLEEIKPLMRKALSDQSYSHLIGQQDSSIASQLRYLSKNERSTIATVIKTQRDSVMKHKIVRQISRGELTVDHDQEFKTMLQAVQFKLMSLEMLCEQINKPENDNDFMPGSSTERTVVGTLKNMLTEATETDLE